MQMGIIWMNFSVCKGHSGQDNPIIKNTSAINAETIKITAAQH